MIENPDKFEEKDTKSSFREYGNFGLLFEAEMNKDVPNPYIVLFD